MQEVNSELARQMRTLAEIARKQGIPIIVTNQVYNWNGSWRMVAGDILQYWSKCLIELTNDNGKRTAHLRKHRSLPEKRLDFVITNDDIKKRGWL
jgi:DNA repair protein RadB